MQKHKKKTPVKTKQAIRGRAMHKNASFCPRCGTDCLQWGVKGTIDHIIPKSLGGPDDESNYIGMCKTCNNKKGNKIVLPSCYYYQMNNQTPFIQRADEMVIKYLKTYDIDIYKNPLLFEELIFSIKTSHKSIHSEVGWNPHGTIRVACDVTPAETLRKMNWMLPLQISPLSKYDFKESDDYVYYYGYNIDKACPEFLLEGHFNGSSVKLKVIAVNHRKRLIANIRAYVDKVRSVYKKLGVQNIIVYSPGILLEKSIMERDMGSDVFIMDMCKLAITI